MMLIIIIIGTFYFFNRARNLGVTYYSRFHFTIQGCLLVTLLITTILMLQNYQFNIDIYQHNPLNFKYLSAWVITYLLYLPWVFIGNLGLKSYGQWAQKKYEEDLETARKVSRLESNLIKYAIMVLIYKESVSFFRNRKEGLICTKMIV